MVVGSNPALSPVEVQLQIFVGLQAHSRLKKLLQMVILKQVPVQKHPEIWPTVMLASLISKSNTRFLSASKSIAVLKRHNLTMNVFSFSIYLDFLLKP